MKAIPDLSDLSLRERIGQTLCFGWQGATPEESQTVNAHALELVEEMGVGSVVLLGRNVGTPEVTRAMLDELQSLSAIPLFIAIDQEGGSVNRFRAPFHEFPGNMALGATGDPDLARRQAEAQARELRAVGVNWNFAPVVDVNNNPDNPIIGVRSYGEDPGLVARFGTAAMRGYQNAGILACAKHFPGHGDTSVDSHLALPTVSGDRSRLEKIELLPFRAVIEAGVGAIMTTHILFPALDSARPATLSPAILTGLLRSDLGYDGLVITDCLEMEAIASTIGTPRGAVEALKAGADIALVCHTLETQRATVQAIQEAVESGELPESRLNEAVGRVLAAKRRFLTDPPPAGEAPWLDPAHDSLEREIARKSITVVRNTGRIPLRVNANDDFFVISAHHAASALAEEVQRHQRKVGSVFLPSDFPDWPLENVISILLNPAHRNSQVVFATAPREPWSEKALDQERQGECVRKLLRFVPDLVVVALREPYDLRRFPAVRNYICTYGYRPCSLEALADALFGAFGPSGKLPVTIPVKSPASIQD